MIGKDKEMNEKKRIRKEKKEKKRENIEKKNKNKKRERMEEGGSAPMFLMVRPTN